MSNQNEKKTKKPVKQPEPKKTKKRDENASMKRLSEDDLKNVAGGLMIADPPWIEC